MYVTRVQRHERAQPPLPGAEPATPPRRQRLTAQPGVAVRLSHNWHPVDELAWSLEGTAWVKVHDTALAVTPEHAVYVPAGVAHHVEVPAEAMLAPLFLPSMHALGPQAHRVRRSPALDALAAPLMGPHPGADLPGEARAFVRTLRGHDAEGGPPWPLDERAAAVAEAVRRDPGGRMTLQEHAERLGVSARTLQRAFQANTGLGFTQWRARWRLARATTLLRDGATVSEAAAACGYTASSFIARYRAEFGVTPGQRAGR
ncbi:MAG: AraC family transcriptional regulator [Arthrobacter sp.]|jgi:AraC-like DNA-binding protein|nr:AraC family transcriptional regulator [Arthrobacter sp.]